MCIETRKYTSSKYVKTHKSVSCTSFKCTYESSTNKYT